MFAQMFNLVKTVVMFVGMLTLATVILSAVVTALESNGTLDHQTTISAHTISQNL